MNESRFSSPVRIDTSSGADSHQYRNFEPESITSKPEVSVENCFFLSDPKFADVLAAMGNVGIHPSIETNFSNPLAADLNHLVTTERIAALRNQRGNYTYIDETSLEYTPRQGRHCLTVGLIVHAFTELIDLPEEQKALAIRQGVSHDVNKFSDVLSQRILDDLKLDPIQFSCLSNLDPNSSKDDQRKGIIKKLMEHNAVPGDLVELAIQAAGFTGHNSIAKFLNVSDGGRIDLDERNLPALLVHLADDMASEQTILTVNERMVASHFVDKYEYLWSLGLAYNSQKPDNGLVEVELSDLPSGYQLVGCYADLQVATSNAITGILLGKVKEAVSTEEASQRPEVIIKNRVAKQLNCHFL